MLRWRNVPLVVGLTLGLALAGPAAAAAPAGEDSPAIKEAKRHYVDGVAFFNAGDYARARVELEAGYQLSKLPDFLINLCITAEKQNQPADAVAFCEQYLRSQPSSEDAPKIRARLERLRKQAANPGAPIEPEAPNPPGSSASIATPASPDSSAAAAPPAPGGRGPLPKPALALLAGGGALLLIGIGTGAGALATAKQVDGMAISIVYSDLLDLTRRGEALNTTSIVFSLTGGAAVIAGAGWLGYWLAHRPR